MKIKGSKNNENGLMVNTGNNKRFYSFDNEEDRDDFIALIESFLPNVDYMVMRTNDFFKFYNVGNN